MSSALRFAAAASPLARSSVLRAPCRLISRAATGRTEEDGPAGGQGSAGWTPGEFHSIEQTLEDNLGAEDLANVKRVLYGMNQGAPVQNLAVPLKAQELARKYDYGTAVFVGLR